MRRSLFLGLGVILLIAADKPSDAVQKELAKFEGVWKIESLEVGGNKAAEESFKDTRLTLKGDHFEMTDSMGTTKGIFKLDVNQKPKTIDMEFTEGPIKGKTIAGIYELEGDTYKLCIVLGGKERPKEFASKPGTGLIVEVLKRVKP